MPPTKLSLHVSDIEYYRKQQQSFIRAQKYLQKRNKYKNEDYKKGSEHSHLEIA